MRDHLPDILVVQCIQQVEEEFTVRAAARWVIIGHVLHHIGVVFELREQVLHTQFIVTWDHDELDILKLHHLLLTGQHKTNIILGDHLKLRVNCEGETYLWVEVHSTGGVP